MKKKIFIVTIISAMITIISASTVGASTYLNVFKKAIWKLAMAGVGELSNKLINVEGTTEYDIGWVRKSTGGFDFNTGINGASVKITCNLADDNMELDAFPYTDPIHWFSKIAYILTSPDNRDVINKTLTHNQHATFKSKKPYGVYTARFVEDESMYWNCYTTFTDWSDVFTDGFGRNINGIMSKKPYVIKDTTQQVYFIPSLTHTISLKSIKSVDTLNMNELIKQFYDTGIENFVTSLKDYNIGDKLIFNDVIKALKYDAQNNCTYLSFDSITGVVTWPFKGDLTSRFSVGSCLALEFQIVEDFSYNGIAFENIDYFVDGYNALQNNNYLPIEKYLMN